MIISVRVQSLAFRHQNSEGNQLVEGKQGMTLKQSDYSESCVYMY